MELKRNKTKKKRIWMRITLWTVAVLIILLGVGVFAANYAINKTLDSLSTSLDEEIKHQDSHYVSTESATNQTTPSPNNPTPIEDNSETEYTNDSQGNPLESNTDDSSQSSNNSDNGKVKPDKEKDKLENYSASVSTNKAAEIKNNVTVSEKVTVTKIMMNKLSMSDIKTFQKLAGGGLTVDEKKEAKKVLLEKLSPEEYDELIAIAKKYGVSKGKTYEQSQDENL